LFVALPADVFVRLRPEVKQAFSDYVS